MSYRNRRQSIYLQRNSISRTNSYDGNFASTRKSIIASATSSGSSLLDTFKELPPPDLKMMKVYKGYEFVTFKPVQILPSSSSRPEQPNQIDNIPSSSAFHQIPKLHSTETEQTYDQNDDEMNAVIESRVQTISQQWNHSANIKPITANEARQCLYEHVHEKFCHGSKAAREMTIMDMHHSLIVRYTLESVCQRRKLCWTFEPYVDPDSPLDGTSSNGQHQTPPDDPWMIQVNQVKDLEDMASMISGPTRQQSTCSNTLEPIKEDEQFEDEQEECIPSSLVKNQMDKSDCNLFSDDMIKQFKERIFQDQCLEVSVPGTQSIHSCHVCAGVGRKRCLLCVGSGSTKCEICDGAGYYGFDHHKTPLARTLSGSDMIGGDYCWRCRGRGRLRCECCTGIGMTGCMACAGSGQIKCFIKMIVTLTNHHNSLIIRDQYSWQIPFDQVKMADGHIVMDEDGLNLNTTLSQFFNDNLIMNQIERLMQLHRQKYLQNSKLILQRHRIKLIPVVQVLSTWRGSRFKFYVFSRRPHCRCYMIDYPERCCCCLSTCCCSVQ